MDSLFAYAKTPHLVLPRVQSLIHEAVDDWNTTTIIQLLSIVAGLLITHRITTVIHNIWFHPLSKFPGPTHMAAFYFPYLYRNMVSGQMHKTIEKLHRKYGPIVRVGPDHLAVDGSIGWPQVFERKTNKAEYEKVPGFYFEGDTIGLLSAPKDVHRRQRRQLNHAFSDAALRDQEVIINKYLDLLMQRLTERSNTGESLNIVDWMNFITFDIIGHLTYSESFHCLENNGYHPWVLQLFAGVRGQSYRRFLSSYPLLFEIVKAFNLNSSVKAGDDQKYYLAERATERKKLGGYAIEGYRDFMSYMLKQNQDGYFGFNWKETLAVIPAIITAGSETTASTMSALMFLLGTCPKVYEKLVEEIRSSFALEHEITLTSTRQLEYLHACLEETLRFYPPASETPPRTCPGDTIAGRYVPAGTKISLYQRATYNSPEHFAEPDSYIPERWLPESHPLYNPKFKDDNHAVFKPFSFGSRDCIGKNLAYSELRMITSRLLHRFDFELLPGQEDWQRSQRTFLVWEKGPLNIKLKCRDLS
ncbi:cytochrome p450 3a17 [Trichoderma arundinaceum]|uniref:Cytochrome p450 3a17 n=1 Tax=Trichoderma arundinaceum TaxID=490622 RepID=A0A395P011_TRIAR|nr:cytochrome p450 3a17 [Trichoderma arundinaceum]